MLARDSLCLALHDVLAAATQRLDAAIADVKGRSAAALLDKLPASPAGAQSSLPTHSDQSLLSFTIQLNGPAEYEGGGTWFDGLGEALPIERGHVCTHASGVLHGGHPIESGVRYILVAFVLCEGYQNWAMRFMKSVWDF